MKGSLQKRESFPSGLPMTVKCNPCRFQEVLNDLFCCRYCGSVGGCETKHATFWSMIRYPSKCKLNNSSLPVRKLEGFVSWNRGLANGRVVQTCL